MIKRNEQYDEYLLYNCIIIDSDKYVPAEKSLGYLWAPLPDDPGIRLVDVDTYGDEEVLMDILMGIEKSNIPKTLMVTENPHYNLIAAEFGVNTCLVNNGNNDIIDYRYTHEIPSAYEVKQLVLKRRENDR